MLVRLAERRFSILIGLVTWNGPASGLVVGASFSHHAQGGGIWPDGAGMPDPQP
jgi:hypothetical protein